MLNYDTALYMRHIARAPSLGKMVALRCGAVHRDEAGPLFNRAAWGDVSGTLPSGFITATCRSWVNHYRPVSLRMGVATRLRVAYHSGEIVATLDSFVSLLETCVAEICGQHMAAAR